MASITSKTTLAELGAIVCEGLRSAGLDAFLSGGAVVSIYTNNRYESFDLDFVSLNDRSKIKRVMEELGFTQEKGCHFVHAKSKFFVEFPGSAVRVGEFLINRYNELEFASGRLKLLTPTDCVKDRLAAFYHRGDRQGLDQAVWVAIAQPVNLSEIKNWSKSEGLSDKYAEFEKALKSERAAGKRPKGRS